MLKIVLLHSAENKEIEKLLSFNIIFRLLQLDRGDNRKFQVSVFGCVNLRDIRKEIKALN